MARGYRMAFVCSSCGRKENKWLGQCPSCGNWNSFTETRIGSETSHRAAERADSIPQLLSEVDPSPAIKQATGMAELDRVLGGGLSAGSAVLLGGEPGIGKSTLMLQVAAELPGTGLYVSGEESPGQIKNRAERLQLRQDSLKIVSETNLEALMETLSHSEPDYLVLDSIQTMASTGSQPGTPHQLKHLGHCLNNWAKTQAVPVFLIAHVTKEGIIAGPKLIEHLVDTVLYFDHSSSDLRILRASKNRMGSVDEVGLFRMGSSGLTAISDPTGLFLEHRNGGPPVGTAVTAVYEGSRILLVEIQALVVPSKGAAGRVYSDRIEAARVSRIAAVLERHARLVFSDQDIYVNVAGGLRISDTGAELAVALALASARSEKAIAPQLASFGELSLAGEIRGIPHLRRRIKTAVDTGYETWFAAVKTDESGEFPGQGRSAETLRDVIAEVFS